MAKRREYNLKNAINRVEEDVRSILTKRQSGRYLEGLFLMYTLIESVLKWSVFLQIIWNKSDRVLRQSETETLKQFCNQQDFYSTLNLALVTGFINYQLFKRIERIRSERNDLSHQFYLFTHRHNTKVLRAKLERMVNIADDLFSMLGKLVEETGIDDSYDIFNIRRKKQMLI